MPDVAVVTDTTHYLPRDTIADLGVGEVSLYVNDGERHEREADIRDLTAFYDALRTAASLPTTSQPSIGDFLAVYEPLARDGRDVVSIHISGGISGTVEAARQAAAELDGSGARIEVIDSKLACGALGMVILATAARARAGADVEAVAARAREAAGATRLWFAVDTLEYLQRGGRIGAAQAWLGGALKIKPILTFDGEIVPIERVRTSGRAFERMVHYLRARHETAPTAGSFSTSRHPTSVSAWWTADARSLAASRCSSRRSDRSSAPTPARASSASAASRWRCSMRRDPAPKGRRKVRETRRWDHRFPDDRRRGRWTRRSSASATASSCAALMRTSWSQTCSATWPRRIPT
jgi:DegV family protein with EDD domain